MERIFAYENGFIKVSAVEHAYHVSQAGDPNHHVHVISHDERLELKFDTESKAKAFVSGLLKEVYELHGITPPETVEKIDVAGKTADEILGMVATIRVNQFGMKKQAADSLGVDIRTLKRYSEIGQGEATVPDTQNEI